MLAWTFESSHSILGLNMKKLVTMLRTGPVLVGEFRGGKAETLKRFDKSDKNAAPIEFGMYKFNLELLADGAPVMISVFLDAGIKAEEFAPKVQIRRGDIVAVGVNKLELKNGVRRDDKLRRAGKGGSRAASQLMRLTMLKR
jgi:hypothetical protein